MYLNTVRHLRWGQVAGQCIYRLRMVAERAGIGCGDPGPVPEYPGCGWEPGRIFRPAAELPNWREDLLAGRMEFLNIESAVGWPPQWAPDGLPRLWVYNLHYHDWLWALEYPEARDAALDWIKRHPRTPSATGWEPYPLSLRIANWCELFWGRWREEVESDPATQERLWASLFAQTERLASRLEYHLGGNHLLENAMTLAMVGSCFGYNGNVFEPQRRGERREELPPWRHEDTKNRIARWKEKGLRMLERELVEQILPDGMHYERSPMYHLRTLAVLENLVATGDEELIQIICPRLDPMRRALTLLCHPDENISLFNDSAFKIYPQPHNYLLRQSSPPVGAWALADAGYYGWRDASGNYLNCDAGAIGPDHIPGHAHADIFSFELSLAGRRVIVDAGTHDYVPGPMRAYCRSTAAHNTVEIEGQDQCEMWGAFRVARRGKPRDVKWSPGPEGFTLEGGHDGYRRLPGRPVHRRCFEWRLVKGLQITDTITAELPVRAVSRLHLHPDCRVERAGAGVIVLREGETVCTVEARDCSIAVAFSAYCPEFNRALDGTVLAIEGQGTELRLCWSIVPTMRSFDSGGAAAAAGVVEKVAEA